jgi:hypothetical protein
MTNENTKFQEIQGNGVLPFIRGCFIVNNEKTPIVCEHYYVIYTDGTEGIEFFNGNMWLVNYKHPVKLWWLILNDR